MKDLLRFFQMEQEKTMELTLNQERARDVKGGNYLVSASAGSGKTSVLTQRAFTLIKDGTKLSELLILTFTNLAAAEMRDRIRLALLDEHKPELDDVASSLDAANIQTYDAYALNIVKKYYYMVGLSKDISIVDQTLLELEQHKLIEQILNEHFDAHDEKVLKLIDDYCLKNSNELKDFIINVSNKLDLKENKEEYIKTYISTFFKREKIEKDVNEFIQKIAANINKIIQRIKTFENIDYVDAYLPILERMASATNYDALRRELNSEENKFPRLVKELSLGDYPDDKAYHDYFKKLIDNYRGLLKFESLDDLVNQSLGTKDNVETILSLVEELDRRINTFKKKYNVYSFADIFKFALQIVSIPEINKELKNKYKYIMIDEYQDTSDIQEKFINKIANNNVYVVGDVKQSIYRFRNANCDLFLDKFNKYGQNDGGERIELPENFRSRKEVVDSVNEIFSVLMDKKNSGLDYKNEHMMKHGNKSYISANSSYFTEFLDYELGDKYVVHEHEARLIATDIAKKINDGFEVYDKDKKEIRAATYSDFAIIMFSKKDFLTYQKVFNEYQIPLFANYNKSIRENNLTMTFENIISLLYLFENKDFSTKFRHSFISVLRSFLFEVKDDELSNLVHDKNYERFELYSIIEKISNKTKGLNLKEKIIHIIHDFDIYNKLIRIGDISNNTSLLDYYYSIASQMDNMGYTLEDFKKYFDDLKEFEIDPEYSPSDDVKNCVKLLSIHASKGLQFKVCYFAELYKQFNVQALNSKLQVDSINGIDIPNVYHEPISSFYHTLITKKEKNEQLLEQLRVFYVALTRAEEKIILLNNINARKNAIQTFEQINTFTDFLLFSNPSFNRYTLDIELIKRDETDKEDDDEKIIISNPVSLSSETKENKHASKELDSDTDEALLYLGNKYHYYLELVDFKTLDTSFIKDELDKKRINRFLANDLFKNMKDANIMHEYPFYDEEDNVSGVIDLLVEHQDHIDIIDFKLSHVDDEAYEKQLKTYKKYISKLSDKKIDTYVTGILSGDIKKID